MRIATISSMDFGGAGIGSLRRIKALRDAGIDAQLFVLSKQQNSEIVHKINLENRFSNIRGWRGRWKHVIGKTILPIQELEILNSKEAFSNTVQVSSSEHLRSLVEDFDVVHLHWVVGILDYEHIARQLGSKPIVWTLADMNPFTGGCHYSEGCREYENSCSSCPLLSHASDLASASWEVKNDSYANLENLSIVCPSASMKALAEQSSLLRNRPIHYIPNPFPKDDFEAEDKEVARSCLGLPNEKILLVFGADSLSNPRKGGDLLVQALLLLKKEYDRWDSIEIILFGNQRLKLPFKSHNLGFITESSKLALAYSAADAFLFPSLEDNAPLTVSEALFCNTPVVTFPVGSAKDIVHHKHNGYVAESEDIEDFTKGILWVIEHREDLKSLDNPICRNSANAFHDNESIVQAHIKLYEQIQRL